jgi:hypothetical protein
MKIMLSRYLSYVYGGIWISKLELVVLGSKLSLLDNLTRFGTCGILQKKCPQGEYTDGWIIFYR